MRSRFANVFQCRLDGYASFRLALLFRLDKMLEKVGRSLVLHTQLLVCVTFLKVRRIFSVSKTGYKYLATAHALRIDIVEENFM